MKENEKKHKENIENIKNEHKEIMEDMDKHFSEWKKENKYEMEQMDLKHKNNMKQIYEEHKNNMYKIEIPNIKDFNIKELKQTPLNLNINNEVISFIVTKDFNETLKYLASLRPAFINIQRPYIGEIFNEALPTL